MTKRICILGGSGFVGSTISNKLVQQGYQVRILTRQREKHRELLVLPDLELLEADVHDPQVLQRYFQGQDVVINLIGILNERRDNGAGFRHAHVELSKKVIAACRENKIRRLLHMSALNASNSAPSYYLRSKADAEDIVHAASNLHVTSFRPSVIFGPHDSFFNNFASLARLSPLLLPLACANARFAPVYVGDVADAFVSSISNPLTYGQRYDLCGPEELTLEQVLQLTMQITGIKRFIIPLGPRLSKMMATLFTYMPFFKPLTLDNYRSLQVDSVCSSPQRIFPGLRLRHMGEIVPQYLRHGGFRSSYSHFRKKLSDH